MRNCKIIVREYGKIKSAEIEPASLVAFIGDNNSGKSYLTSLLWGFQNFDADYWVDSKTLEDFQKDSFLQEWMDGKVQECFSQKEILCNIEPIALRLQELLNQSLDRKKDDFVKKIFNNEQMAIGKLEIVFNNISSFKLQLVIDEGYNTFSAKDKTLRSFGIFLRELGDKNEEIVSQIKNFLIKAIYISFIGLGDKFAPSVNNVYMPAARTGFMLTKNVINQVGRDIAFNNMQERERTMTPFVRPINHFLDVMNRLSQDGIQGNKYVKVLELLERKMVNGTVDINSLPAKEVFYTPKGEISALPLRMASAVVSELSPLILVLKYLAILDTIYYEEPEMCLHPQLQYNIARVICKLVNRDVNMVITTHSDIIIQHFNNMIKLNDKEKKSELLKHLGYDFDDLLSRNKVKVYQFDVGDDDKTVVSELKCGEYGFEARTFYNTLMMLNEQIDMIEGTEEE